MQPESSNMNGLSRRPSRRLMTATSTPRVELEVAVAPEPDTSSDTMGDSAESNSLPMSGQSPALWANPVAKLDSTPAQTADGMEDGPKGTIRLSHPGCDQPSQTPAGSGAKGAEQRCFDHNNRNIIIAAIVALALTTVLVGLGVGLSLGLQRRDRDRGRPGEQGFEGQLPPGTRTYFVAADPVSWDYARQGNQCFDASLMQPVWQMENKVPPANVGGTFKKAKYQEYTDSTFTALKTIPDSQAHLGLLGPLIRAEAGSVVQVVFKNNLPFAVNMEPSGGITWEMLGPSGFTRPVAPGEVLPMLWQVPLDAAPAPQGPGQQSSRLYLYRSSVDLTGHDNAGLVGPIIVTAKGYANPDGTTQGVDRDIIAAYQVIDETASPFVFDNGKLNDQGSTNYLKMTINGHTWCNLANATANAGEAVRWHVAAVGGEESVHNFHWHGNTLAHNGHHMDQISLLGSNTASLDMRPDSVGTWLFHCHVNKHIDNGMIGYYTIGGTAPPIAPAPGGVERVYYVAAEEVMWDFAPLGGVACSGSVEPFNPDMQASTYLGDTAGFKIGSKSLKAQYIQYTDATFTKPVNRSADEAYLGILGPVMRANVGDVIKVVFLNRLRYPASMHPHGVIYDKTGEGAPYNDGTDASLHLDDVVMPNKTYTYRWGVAERSGPGPTDPSSIMWMYHSHVDETADTYAGMFGAIIINRAGAASGLTMLPSDIDQDAVFFFSVMDEWASIYANENVQQFLNPVYWNDSTAIHELFQSDDFHEACRRHMINGFMYCNSPHALFAVGKRTRLHVMALGSQVDLHTPSIQGGSFFQMGIHGSSLATVAGGMMSTDVVFTQPGVFNMECRVADHVMAGMEALYTVLPPANGGLAIAGTVTRNYYIAADPVTWDYAPNGYVQCTNENMAARANVYIKKTNQTLGSRRLKALYRQYTDQTFTTLTTRPASYGLLGPYIAAEVGDVITVVFKNNLDFAVTFSPDGGLVPMHNTTEGASIAPGATFTYTYIVPVQAGPIPGDLSITAYAYFSDVDLPAHSAAGLVGILTIAARGTLKPDGVTPNDVDMVIPLLFQVHNENMSPFNDANIQAANLDNRTLDSLARDSDFATSFQNYNMMHAINGYMYCNLPVTQVPLDARARLVMMGVGSEEGLHTPRVVGQVLKLQSGAVQSAQLMPSVAVVGDLTTASPGIWPLLCDIHEHMTGGMMGQIQIGTAGQMPTDGFGGPRDGDRHPGGDFFPNTGRKLLFQ